VKSHQVTVACVSFCPVYSDKAATLDKMELWIKQAATRGCDLIVFPEGALTSWSNCGACQEASGPCRRHIDEVAEPADGPAVQSIARLCRELDVYVVFGFIERDADQADVLYNSVAVIAPEGAMGTYRKVHLGGLPFTTEGLTFTPGQQLPVWRTRFGTIGICICFDFWLNPEIPRLLALKGAQIIVNPTASGSSRDEIVGGSLVRSRENVSFVAVANLVGSPNGPKEDRFTGHSVITGPEYPQFSRILAEGGGCDEELVIATVDLSESQRWAQFYPWREWRRGRLAGASALIADEFAALARNSGSPSA
jgi:predicted amidohydrolase